MARPLVAVDGRLMFHRRAGISQYTRGLVRGLAALSDPRFDLLLLLDRRDRDLDWVPPGLAVARTLTPAHHRLEALAWPVELAARWPRLRVLHAPDFIAPRGRFRKVITIHDLYFMEHPEVMGDDGRRYYAGTPASAARADAIIAVSAATRADIARLLGARAAKRTTVIDEAGAIPQRAPRAPDDDAPFALFVGTFEPRKNLETLLRALALPAAAGVRLTLVGEAGWGDSAPARLAAELGVAGRVQLAGRVSDAELDALYARARVVVAPSLSEGFGLPALEALARGVPLICAEAGALAEVAGPAALMHPPRDAEALATQLGRIWTDADLRVGLAARGRARAAGYSWARAARETAEVYGRMLGDV
ncbi:MAG: glycosyltransferase family 4 protein [Thermoflexales bacterium]|nr:glycosyltransferase family 4 protein [Thermoflexales bacterium]